MWKQHRPPVSLGSGFGVGSSAVNSQKIFFVPLKLTSQPASGPMWYGSVHLS